MYDIVRYWYGMILSLLIIQLCIVLSQYISFWGSRILCYKWIKINVVVLVRCVYVSWHALKEKGNIYSSIFWFWLLLFKGQFRSILFIILHYIWTIRGGSRTAATSKMEFFVIIVNSWKPLTIITKSSILNVAAVLDLLVSNQQRQNVKIKITLCKGGSRWDIKLPQVGLELAWLLTTRHKFVSFDVTSHVDIDCARSSLCQAC